MIGGTTYEEAKTIAQINQQQSAASSNGGLSSAGARLLLGGTCVHNSTSCVFRFPYISYSIYSLPIDTSK